MIEYEVDVSESYIRVLSKKGDLVEIDNFGIVIITGTVDVEQVKKALSWFKVWTYNKM